MKKKTRVSIDRQSASDFTNVLDIRGKLLYSRDGNIFGYLRILPVSLELLSQREKETLSSILTAELSRLTEPFKFIALSRPIDITPLIDEYSFILKESDDEKQKELLRYETRELKDYMNSGDVVERQFYITLWQKYKEKGERDLLKRLNELSLCFEAAGVKTEILKEDDIIGLINMVNNPSYIHLEDTNYTDSFLKIERKGDLY